MSARQNMAYVATYQTARETRRTRELLEAENAALGVPTLPKYSPNQSRLRRRVLWFIYTCVAIVTSVVVPFTIPLFIAIPVIAYSARRNQVASQDAITEPIVIPIRGRH